MASGSSYLSEDQFLCSICLDVFTEPVSIPCGHNFCKACITRHWGGKQQCCCPLCNETFNKELKLCVNTTFREVVESFKKHRQEISHENSNFFVKPGQVPCDCCLGNKFKASKTCLVCLASYCDMHLEPHQRVDALKRHTLTEPVHNLEDKICKEHHRMLELFCRDDLTCICVLCTDHSAHETVPLEKAFANKKSQVRKKKTEAKRTSGKKNQKAKLAMQTKRKDKNEATPGSAVSNQMQAPSFWWFPSEVPHNFNRYVGHTGFFEGRFCYEIEAKERIGWSLGVVTESVCGKGTFIPLHRDGNWIIRVEPDNRGPLPRYNPVHLFFTKTPERVLLFLDFESALVSFFDPHTNSPIYSLSGCKFIERIFIFFIPCSLKDVSWAQRLRYMVQKIKALSQLSNNSFYFILMVCIALFFVIFILPK